MTLAPKVKKIVTRPVLRFEKEKPFYVRVLAAMYTGAMPKQRTGSSRAPVAPWFVDVTNLDDKSEATLPVHPKLKEALEKAYPDEAYVSKCFSITAKTRQRDKQFTPFHIAEIEDPDAEEKPAGEVPTPIASKRR